MKDWGVAFALIVALAMPAGAAGEPLPRDEVPAPLVPWVDWVLHDAGDAVCPFVHGMGARRQCLWPARLELRLDAGGGSFRQRWRLDREAWVPLPGAAKSWPQSVVVGERSTAVVERDGVPSVRLARGRHTIEGRFDWTRLPESLAIPAETGLVSLRVGGRSVPFPERDRCFDL